MSSKIKSNNLIIITFIFFFIWLLFYIHPISNSHSEIYSKNINIDSICDFNYNNHQTVQCYIKDFNSLRDCNYQNTFSNSSTNITSLNSNVIFHPSNFTSIWKSVVHPSNIIQDRYSNVGEPSIAFNGTNVFYTGNHYAAKSKIGSSWDYVDPSLDFKANPPPIPSNSTTNSTGDSSSTLDQDLFKADQRAVYDPYHHMYIWIRLGDSYLNPKMINIERLAVSKDTVNWKDFDIKSTDLVINGISDAQLDYPETIISKNYLYLTSSIVVVNSTNFDCQKSYGTIMRIPLKNLSNSLNHGDTKVPLDVIIDKNVTGISPVEGMVNNSAYFGAQINNNMIKIYQWNESSNAITNKTIPIALWNDIHNKESCKSDTSKSDSWWCLSNTSSRIRSAWLYNNSLNFLWNAVTTFDNGSTWKPYIDVATFNLKKNMSYERKYHISEYNSSWAFGAAVPSQKGNLGIIAYYVANYNNNNISKPYLNLAFGIFNKTSNKWDMMPLINSSVSLPIKDKNWKENYDFGDFITIREHPVSKERYLWDAGAYVIVGDRYYNVDPYFIMIK